MQGTCSRVASGAPSTLVSAILVAVEAGNITQVLASRAGNIGGMDTGR